LNTFEVGLELNLKEHNLILVLAFLEENASPSCDHSLTDALIAFHMLQQVTGSSHLSVD
jgi:hypothetical protein